MSSLSFDPIADRYDATRGGAPRGRYVAELLVPWLPADGVVSEIGVGTALVAAAVAERGITVVGVDISAGMLARAAERHAGWLTQADAAALPFADGSLAATPRVFHVVGDPGGCWRRARGAGARRPGRRRDHRREPAHRPSRSRVAGAAVPAPDDALDQPDPPRRRPGRSIREPLAPFRQPTAAVGRRTTRSGARGRGLWAAGRGRRRWSR